MESVTAVPDAAFNFPPLSDTGQTRNYGFGSPANGSTLSSGDEDGIPNDCYLWNAAGQAPHPWIASVTYPSAHQALVTFSGTASNPLEPQFGGIQWSMLVKLDTSNPGAPAATVSYQNTCYPAHEIAVNGQVIYSYIPTNNSTTYIVSCLAPGAFGALGVSGQLGPITVPLQQ
jgi:hypothetical protein